MLFLLCLFPFCFAGGDPKFPIAINTWSGPFANAAAKAFQTVARTNDPVLAVVEGCRVCQELQCEGSVGFGGSPDESGDTTLDSMIINGDTMQVGAVGYLSRVKDAIGVAYQVYQRTDLTLLAGLGAVNFAKSMGFELLPNLETNVSQQIYKEWLADNCQPNFWKNVSPDPSKNCGPYSPSNSTNSKSKHPRDRVSHVWADSIDGRRQLHGHDTIAMVVISATGSIAAGVSTNGLSHKIVGRIGDSALPGAGALADSEVGGCGETGDGDIMLRFSPCALVVEWMRQGMTPKAATAKIIARIARFFPKFIGGIIAINKVGEFGAAAYGWTMTYTLANSSGVFVFSEPSQ